MTMPALPFCPVPKYPNGTTLQEERECRRAQREKRERLVKAVVRKRDHGTCRVPGCKRVGEVAHIDAKGAGGDHGIRTTTHNMACICHTHHQGPDSIHSGDLKVIALTARGCDGPLLFRFAGGRVLKENTR